MLFGLRRRGRALGKSVSTPGPGGESWRGLEPLEPRLLMAATQIDPLDDLFVMGIQSTSVDLKKHFDDPTVTGTLVQFNSNMGTFYAEMLNADALATVNNFLAYADAGRYVDSFVHRSADLANGNDFVVQGGGFIETAAPPFQITAVQTFPAIQNQFKNSNLRGTLAMARLGGQPNSATSQWFVNVSDNTFLDSVDGGFTVFGRVLDNGMQIVDAIAALPTYDMRTRLSNNAMGELPLINYNQGNPADPNDDEALRHDHLVAFTSIRRVGELTFQVVSFTNSRIFNIADTNNDGVQDGVTIDSSGNLQLKFSGVSGVSTIVIRATDRLGNTVEDSFTIRVSPPTGLMGVREVKRRIVTFALQGPGGIVASQNADRSIDVSLIGTSAVSSMGVGVLRGKAARIGQISVAGSVFSISGSRVDLTGELFVTGVARSIVFRDVRDGGSITLLGINKQAADTVSIRLRDVFESQIASAIPITSLTVARWVDADTTADIITAPWIGDLDATGRKRKIAGDFAADLALNSAGDTDKTLNSAEIKGTLSGATWRASRSIGLITAARVVDSKIFAGVKATVTGLPATTDDFTATPTGKGPATIEVLAVPGARRSKAPAFANSIVAARSIGVVALGLVQTTNNGTSHGFAAQSPAGGGNPFTSFTYRNPAGEAVLVSGARTDENFLVRLV